MNLTLVAVENVVRASDTIARAMMTRLGVEVWIDVGFVPEGLKITITAYRKRIAIVTPWSQINPDPELLEHQLLERIQQMAGEFERGEL